MDIVLGSTSMIGKELVKLLNNPHQISHEHYNLVNFENCWDAFDSTPDHIDTIYMLAGYNGGIEFNKNYPADIFFQTAQMNLNVLRCCKVFGVKKIVNVLASCSYPDLGETVLEESMLWQGLPNDSVSCHGLSKRMIHAYSIQLHKQHGIKTVNAVLTNCYGPGDRFALDRTKVVGAVIKKVCDGKLNNTPSLTFFGTGQPKREIMFCRDAAKALVQLSQTYDDYLNPVNVGSDQEISIKELVNTVLRLVEYHGNTFFDTSKPDGQMRKKLSTVKMRNYVSLEMTPLEDGLKETIQYYMDKGRFLER